MVPESSKSIRGSAGIHAKLENELVEARQTAALQKAAIAQRDQDMARLQQDQGRLSTEFSSLQATHTALQSERDLQEQQIKAASALHAELRSQVDAMSGALAQTKSELATLSAEKLQFQERIATLEVKVQSLLDENKALAIDKARLEGLHSQPAAQIAGAT